MNRKKKYFLALVAVIVSGTNASVYPTIATTSQQHAQLNKVSSVYKGYKTIQADFSFEYFRNEKDVIGRKEQGRLLLDQTSGKYRISTPAQEMISDGKAQWAILKEAQEVQVTDVDTQTSGITPLNVFSFFTDGYSLKILDSEKSGNLDLEVIELTPEDRRKTYSKIELRINKANNHIVNVTVFDKNRSRYRYGIVDLKANQLIPEEKFTFDPAEHPGIEIVDLR